jgi:hypothetical protein
LHGEFVKGEPHTESSVQPVFPDRPVFTSRLPPPARPAKAASGQPAFRQERLDSLLDTIKQDLNQLVRK